MFFSWDFFRVHSCNKKKDAVVKNQYHSVHEMNDILVFITKIN